MKAFIKKNIALILVLVLFTAVFCYYGSVKSGFFVDELYTFGLSNGHYTPFVNSIRGGDMTDTVITSEEFHDYLTLADGYRFDFASVWYNQSQDVHPPLYYWFFNLWASLTGGTELNKWTGLTIDYILFIPALILLYILTMKVTGSKIASALAVLVYGVSTMGMNTVLLIRMYGLLTTFTMLLVLQVWKIMESQDWRNCILAGIAILLGLMTQYYFVFYAFFLSAAYVIYALIKKEWKGLYRYAICAVIGALAILLVYPPCIEQLFADKLVSGGTALENAMDSSRYINYPQDYIGFVVHEMKAGVLIGFFSIVLWVLFFRKTKKVFSGKKADLRPLVLIIPAGISLVVVAIVSPAWTERYIFNIVPVFGFFAAWAAHVAYSALEDSRLAKLAGLAKKLVLPLTAVLCLVLFYSVTPAYLYPEYPEYNALLSEYADGDCVYLVKNLHPSVTQDLEQLMLFDEVFITDSPDSEALLEYLGDADEFIMYVDVDEYWTSGIDALSVEEILASEGYGECILLIDNGLSDTYLVRRTA